MEARFISPATQTQQAELMAMKNAYYNRTFQQGFNIIEQQPNTMKKNNQTDAWIGRFNQTMSHSDFLLSQPLMNNNAVSGNNFVKNLGIHFVSMK